MREKELTEKLNKAFKNATPDLLDEVMEDCRALRGPAARNVSRQRPGKPARVWLAAAAAALVFLFIGTLIGKSIPAPRNDAVYATVSIDVNPSLEIKINDRERVLAVVPRNEDAKKVIGNMDFSGTSIELTVNALIGSMYRLGYLNESRGAVLVSLNMEDAAKTDDLLERLTAEISDLLQGENGRVIANTFEPTDRIREIAGKYNMPESKASLAARLLDIDPSWEDQPLGIMAVEDLSRLIAAAEAGKDTAGTFVLPDEGQLSMQEAFERALGLAGINGFLEIERAEYNGRLWLITTEVSQSGEPDVRIKAAELEDAVAYFIEFSTLKYDYYIVISADALAGSTVSAAPESNGANPIIGSEIPQNADASVGADPCEAVRATLRSEGLDIGEIDFPLIIELVSDDGDAYYTVRFFQNGEERYVEIKRAAQPDSAEEAEEKSEGSIN